MQDAVARAYTITSLRAGDLAWLRRPYSHRDLSLHIRVWEDDANEVVAFTFLGVGGFNLCVARGSGGDALLDEMLAGVEAGAGAAVETGDPPVGLYTYGLDLGRSSEDRAVAAALERHGFRQV